TIKHVLSVVAITIAAGIVVNTIFSIDWSQTSDFIILELFHRLLALGLLFVGVLPAVIRSWNDQSIDQTPAPWLLWGLIIALGVFFIHASMDFVLAEPGPMTIFAVLLGAAIGLRTPSAAGERRVSRGVMTAPLSGATLLWLTMIGVVAIPTADAEERARDADGSIRKGYLADGAA